MKILFCDPDEKRAKMDSQKLQEKGHTTSSVLNGKEAQQELGACAYDLVFLNIALTSFSAIEVIKFIKFKNLRVKIVLLASGQDELEEWSLGKNNLKKLGIADILVAPYTSGQLEAIIKGLNSNQLWREVQGKNGTSDSGESEVQAFDDQFTSISIEEFFCGNSAIFDVYIRLSQNKYLKILNQGESMEQERLDNYRLNRGVEKLYFKTKDRKLYISFLNHLIEKFSQNNDLSAQTKFSFLENLLTFNIQEIYTKGLGPNALEETFKVCKNLHKTMESVPELKTVFEEFLQFGDTNENYLYLTMIYTDAIAQNIGWVSDHSRTHILMGAMLHDIGRLKLSKNLQHKKLLQVSEDQLPEYKMHCLYGLQLLEGMENINPTVKLIVYQHHESVNGEGFPQGLGGNRIYPPAKIVAFASRVAELCISMQAPPHQVVKKMITSKKEIFAFDSQVVKAFIQSFTNYESDGKNRNKQTA